MTQATSCPSVPVLQQLLLGHGADAESVSLEAHLLHCEKCLQTIRTLPPDDALISSLQAGRDFATPAPRSELLEKLRLRLQEMPPSSLGGDTATAEVTNPNAPTPAPAMIAEDTVWLGPPQQPDEIGRLGGYRVLKELGRGGMGAVYQAEDPKLKRLVALKVMLPRLAADASARRRFLREAQAMAAVHHDHVVTIYQVDEDNGVPFLAMEFLHGMPLDQWLRDGRKPNLAQILRMGREIAEGLAAAHARGLVHRDIKPGNIWLDSDHKGRVKILDFGLARAGTEDVHLTRSGAILGTPAYMSPEQASGQKVDARTDLFSLGSILYRFCTGAMPFSGDNTMALLTNLAISDPKPVRELNPDAPPALAELVMRLLAKKPADRPASAQEVVQQLAAIEKNPQGAAKDKNDGTTQTEVIAPEVRSLPRLAKPKSRRRTAVLALVGAAATLLIAAVGAVVYVQTDRGTLEIKTDDKDVKVSVEQNGAQVDVLDPLSKQQLSIHSGKYTLKLTGVDGAEHEMVIDQGTNPVTLTRGGKVVVTVSRVEKPGEAAKATATVKTSFPPLDEAWVKKVHDLLPDKQVEEVAAELKRRNPGFDGKVTPTISNQDVTGLWFLTDEVTDVTPVRALPELESLSFNQPVTPSRGKGRLSDLSPLKGMKLNFLDCGGTQVSDLSPLKGLPLTGLNCSNTLVFDLSPLNDMRLTGLECSGTPISDLSPLKGMPLTLLLCGQTRVTDLSPLMGMPLNQLNCAKTKVSDLSPLNGMKLTSLECFETHISDLTPLKDMPLKTLRVEWTQVSDLSALKNMNLTGLNCGGTPVSDLSPLKDMKLTSFHCEQTAVTDLSLLKGMPLNELGCDFKPERDTGILRSIKTLETINHKPAAEFWKDVAMKPSFPPLDEAWAKKVRDLPAEKQVEEVAAELKRRNPGFDGKVTALFPQNMVTRLELATDDVADLTPLSALPGLAFLAVSGRDPSKNRLSDLSPIQNLKLSNLNCNSTAVSDLSPLKGMPLAALSCFQAPVSDLTPVKGMSLQTLNCAATRVSDLSPLRGMPLKSLQIAGAHVTDLSALRGLPLSELDCGNLPVSDLSPLKGMKLTSLNCRFSRVSDLSPLEGMPLTDLRCNDAPIADLSPLKGMKLMRLDCQGSRVSDLSPLAGMPLKTLRCDVKPERDAAVLRAMTTLETINGKPAAEFWKDVAAKPVFPPLDEAWVKKVRDLPAEKQVEEVAAELKRRNPGFDGKMTPTITNGVDVTGLTFLADEVTDIMPLRALPDLENLSFGAFATKSRPLADLSPLKGMKLTALDCSYTQVLDLSPLKDMKLTWLNCAHTLVSDLSPLREMKLISLHCDGTLVSDLSPLKGMPLADLSCGGTRVSDLSPLKGMPLTDFRCDQTKVLDLSPLKGTPLTHLNCCITKVSDLSPLKGMKLVVFSCIHTAVSDLSPLKDMKLTVLHFEYTAVTDLSLLKGMPLTNIGCDFKPERDTEILHSIKTLEIINEKPAEEFWKEVDAKAAQKKP